MSSDSTAYNGQTPIDKLADRLEMEKMLSGVLKYAIRAGAIDVAQVMMQSGAKLSRDDLYEAVHEAAQCGFGHMVYFAIANEETLRERAKGDNERLSKEWIVLFPPEALSKKYPLEIKKDFKEASNRPFISKTKPKTPRIKKEQKGSRKAKSKPFHKNKFTRQKR